MFLRVEVASVCSWWMDGWMEAVVIVLRADVREDDFSELLHSWCVLWKDKLCVTMKGYLKMPFFGIIQFFGVWNCINLRIIHHFALITYINFSDISSECWLSTWAKMQTCMKHGSISPGRGKWSKCGIFSLFLELRCDQTPWPIQLFSTVLKRFWPLDSKNVFVLVLAHLEPVLELFEVDDVDNDGDDDL